jgi:putative nucleotidyltransferase with HDIG domain
MKIDFKKELEIASKSMIMIHEPQLLIKLIVRMIVRKLHLRHAAMVVYEPDKDSYILNISRGEVGYKIPQGFTRFTHDSPIIRLFNTRELKPVTEDRNGIVSDDINKLIWRESVVQNHNSNGMKEFLHKVNEQMRMLNAVACVPAFYQDRLLAVLLLGEKGDGSKFEQEELDFFSALASDAAMAIRNAQLFEGLKIESERNRRLFIQTIIVLGSTIEAKDSYTHGHTERVTNYAVAIARRMNENGTAQFNEQFLESLYISGLLHDIGKIGVPEAILNKKEKLTEEEYKIMKQHTVKGVEIVRPLSLSREAIDGIRHHHERYDGLGYPDGLKGEAVPVSASIISVADAFDAMTSDRPYRKGLTKDEAIKQVLQFSGIQFNPVPAKALKELFQRGML